VSNASVTKPRPGTAPLIVLGAGGQLGRALLQTEQVGRAVIGLTSDELDVTDRQAVVSLLGELQPALVINAAAYTAVDRAESESANAFAVNRDGAAHVAEACALLNAPLIHVSTDYVFDGDKASAYREEDEAAPLSVYGRSKLEGERLVRERHARSAILRTSWLFGAAGTNFAKTIIELARSRDTLRIVADQLGRPTPAADLAAALFQMSASMLAEPALSGLFHYAGLEAVSWHGFATEILETAARHIGRRPRIIPITTPEYPTAARRPRNSVLDCSKIAALGIRPRSWHPGLKQVIDRLCAEGKPHRANGSRGSVPCPIFT